MGVLLQVRDVPEDVHRVLKARAADAGMSLSEFVRHELERVATEPPAAVVVERLRRLPPVQLSASAAAVVREMRDAEG